MNTKVITDKDIVLYVNPDGPFSEQLISTELMEAGLSTHYELEWVWTGHKKERVRLYTVNSRFLRNMYEYRARDTKLKFEAYIKISFAIRRWKLQSPMSRKMACAMRSFPNTSKRILERIIKSGGNNYNAFIVSLREEK